MWYVRHRLVVPKLFCPYADPRDQGSPPALARALTLRLETRRPRPDAVPVPRRPVAFLADLPRDEYGVLLCGRVPHARPKPRRDRDHRRGRRVHEARGDPAGEGDGRGAAVGKQCGRTNDTGPEREPSGGRRMRRARPCSRKSSRRCAPARRCRQWPADTWSRAAWTTKRWTPPGRPSGTTPSSYTSVKMASAAVCTSGV